MSNSQEISNNADESTPKKTNDETERLDDSTSNFDVDTVIEYLHWGALFAFVILVVVAGTGL